MSKIVITGGAGFIGSHIAENLARNGHEIIIVDNLDPYYSIDLKKKIWIPFLTVEMLLLSMPI